MEQLQGDERGELRRRLRHALHQLIDQIDLEPGRQTKINVSFKDSGTLYLVLDAKGGLRLLKRTMIYHLDGQGNVIQMAQDLGATAEAERYAKGVRSTNSWRQRLSADR